MFNVLKLNFLALCSHSSNNHPDYEFPAWRRAADAAPIDKFVTMDIQLACKTAHQIGGCVSVSDSRGELTGARWNDCDRGSAAFLICSIVHSAYRRLGAFKSVLPRLNDAIGPERSGKHRH